MGKIYYDMGFLATEEVIESSATDLVGQYVGQTGPKTQKLLEKALGKVLFIDEAYRLAEGHFGKEAMDEIVDCLTKPAFAQRLIVILAGYDADINRLMSINPGLTSRFPETITFRNLHPQECVKLFATLLKMKKHLDIVALDSPSAAFQQGLLHRFETLKNLANWANARDVGTLAKAVYGQLLRTADPTSQKTMSLDEITVLTAFDAMINERRNRAQGVVTSVPTRPDLSMQSAPPQTQDASPPPSLRTENLQASPQSREAQPQEPPLEETASESASTDPRDTDVSDEVWARLQLDKQAADDREKEYSDLLMRQAELEAEQARKQKEEEEEEERQRLEQQRQQEELRHCHAAAEEVAAARLAAEEDEARRRFERERLRRELERRRREEELVKLERKRRRVEEERRKEEAAQRKLRTLGVCVMGFRWIKQASGYGCAGGSHYVSNAQLGLG